jgi:hypothetical protein
MILLQRVYFVIEVKHSEKSVQPSAILLSATPSTQDNAIVMNSNDAIISNIQKELNEIKASHGQILKFLSNQSTIRNQKNQFGGGRGNTKAADSHRSRRGASSLPVRSQSVNSRKMKPYETSTSPSRSIRSVSPPQQTKKLAGNAKGKTKIMNPKRK